jgi:hypothetical protein
MDLRRLRPAEWVLATAAVVLVVALFLPWYVLDVAPGGEVERATFTGWESFSVVDVVLSLCAIVALLAVALQATQRTPALPVIGSVAATWVGVVATVFVTIKLIDAPALEVRGFSVDSLAPIYGAWIGLAGAVGLALGGLLAMRDERPGLVGSTHLESSG